MANLQNFRKRNHVNFLEGVGQKVKHLSEFAGAVKGAWDIGKMLYSGVTTALPYVEMALLAGL